MMYETVYAKPVRTHGGPTRTLALKMLGNLQFKRELRGVKA
jgi:hypothetical protein